MATIRRATSADIRRLSITGMRAFHDDPVMRWLFPDDDQYFAEGGEVLRGPMTSWVSLGEVWCTDDVAALAAWIPPGRPEATATPEPPVADPDPELIERLGLLNHVVVEHTPPDDHWYLQMLATHPDWQRQGLGAQLMHHMFERADTDGLPCYLETETEENVVYYRRHGFEVRSEWDVPAWNDAPGPHMWGMMRPAR